jgi:hypothetical protein
VTLDLALQIVKSAGYRVSRPKSRKLTSRGPTSVVRFADGGLFRMTTHCHDHALDWHRGIGLCKAAWSSRRGYQWPKLQRSYRRGLNVMALC